MTPFTVSLMTPTPTPVNSSLDGKADLALAVAAVDEVRDVLLPKDTVILSVKEGDD